MTAMAAKFLVVVAVAMMLAGALAGITTITAGAAVSTADAAVVDVCRFLPFSSDPSIPGTSKTVFAVRVTNIGSTVSNGPVLAGIHQPLAQKSGLPAVTPGPLQPGQVARFKLAASQLIPGAEMTMIAVFASQTNPSETWPTT